MDSIVPAEAKLYPLTLWQQVARLFQVIEDTGVWPREMCQAKAVFLLKPDEDPKQMAS